MSMGHKAASLLCKEKEVWHQPPREARGSLENLPLTTSPKDELWKADFQDFPEVREGVSQTLIVNKHLFLQTIMINHDLPPICLHFMWRH